MMMLDHVNLSSLTSLLLLLFLHLLPLLLLILLPQHSVLRLLNQLHNKQNVTHHRSLFKPILLKPVLYI